MKQPRTIHRFSSLMLATLLLFTAVWGQSNSFLKNEPVSQQATQPAKTKSEKPTKPEQAKLSTAQFEAVVTPAIQLGHSGQLAFLLPVPKLIILLLLSVALLHYFTLPHFYFSYFQYVFGHHIATNAP